MLTIRQDIVGAIDDISAVIHAATKLQVGDRPSDESILVQFTRTQWHVDFEPISSPPVECAVQKRYKMVLKAVGLPLEHPMPKARLFVRRAVLHKMLRHYAQMHEDFIVSEERYGLYGENQTKLVLEIEEKWTAVSDRSRCHMHECVLTCYFVHHLYVVSFVSAKCGIGRRTKCWISGTHN